MGELRKLQQALERSQEAKQAKSAVPATKPTRAGGGTQVYPVDGEVPTRWATTGDVVIVCWGDPSLVGGELIDLPAIVTRGESNGRMNAQCVVDQVHDVLPFAKLLMPDIRQPKELKFFAKSSIARAVPCFSCRYLMGF